jgi:hypothetical protein
MNKEHKVIGVEGSSIGDCSDLKAFKQSPIISMTDKSIEHFHDEHEHHRGQWVPLAKATGMPILSPDWSFMRTYVLTVDSNAATQSRQPEGKPWCSSTSRRKGHTMESKARAMLTFIRRDDTRRM